MIDVLSICVLAALIAGAAFLAARAQHWRDPRWVGVLAVLAAAVLVAAWSGALAPTG
ncbi:hypothetical protein [Rhodococcus wratislaviensis]|uniref:hypothetical protein n=1 Tax=Rhodococcus wratislaviensis TaxID=44752 RepID=UPI00364EAD37